MSFSSVQESLAFKLIAGWIVSLILAYGIASQSNFSIVQAAGVLVMLTSIGSFILQHHQTDQQPVQSPNDEVDNLSSFDHEEENSTSSRVTATSGLSPTERRVQNELIRTTYRTFTDRPFSFTVHRQAQHLIEDVADAVDSVDEDTVERVWQFTIDDGFFERPPGGNSLQMTPIGVQRAGELGEEVLLDDDVQDEIVDILFAAYREDPSRHRVGRDELLEAVGFDEDVVDHNVWLLEEKGFVETTTSMGAGYHAVEITRLGREVHQ